MECGDKKLLITGFDPFGGERVNPAWEAVRQLPDRIGDWVLVKLQVPTVFGLAGQTALDKAGEVQPQAILCVGQAAGRDHVTPEMVAVNLRYASNPDNAGMLPQDEPVVPGGPVGYFSTLPARAMAKAITAAGLPGAVSLSAGSFVCNDLLYTLLHTFSGTPVRAGFIHVPMLPEQAGGRYPSLPLADIGLALEAAIREI